MSHFSWYLNNCFLFSFVQLTYIFNFVQFSFFFNLKIFILIKRMVIIFVFVLVLVHSDMQWFQLSHVLH